MYHFIFLFGVASLVSLSLELIASSEQGWEPIYYHGSQELWNISGEQEKLINFIFKFYIYRPKENK